MSTTSIYLEYPNSYKIFAWAPFSIAPFAYLYIKSVLHQSVRLRRKEFLLFLPVLLYMLNRIPFYLLSDGEKMQFILRTYQDKTLYLTEPEGLLPIQWAPIIRFIYLLTITIFTVYELIKSRKKIFNLKVINSNNQDIYRFHWIITSILFWGLIAAILGVIIQVKFNIQANGIFLISLWVEILVISIYLFSTPNILYGLIGWIQINNPVRSLQEAVGIMEEDEEISHVSIHKGRNIWLTINEHLQKKRSFTKIGYTIVDLSTEINIPMYLISAVINQEAGKNFNEFINDIRIEYLKTFKKEDPFFESYSNEYIGQKIGFASRTSFITAIKKRTGLLPKDYLDQLD